MPRDSARVALYRAIFTQMSNWLPEEEGAQLRFDFETELARLEAASSLQPALRPASFGARAWRSRLRMRRTEASQ